MAAQAQSFTNTIAGDINDSTFCAGGTNASGAGVVNDLERMFTVSGLSAIGDINVGLVATHTWRGDMDVRLESPLGTEVQLIEADTSGAGNQDNYNIELSDENLEDVNTGSHATANDVAPPFYEFYVRPNNLLSAFDEEDPNGTWTLKICDDYTGQDGQFIRGELILSSVSDADLSLSVSANTTTPQVSDTVTLTYTLSNGGPAVATNVTASALIPAGLTFVSSAGAGAYNNATGVWTLPASLSSGSTTTLTLTTTAATIGAANIIAEVTASDQSDSDSTPNNGLTGEDDYDALTVNVQPSSIPPNLSCPIADQFELEFSAPGSANGWTSGDLTRTFTAFDPVSAANINLDFALTGDTGFLDAIAGTNTPVSQTDYNGGFTGDHSIGIAADFDTTTKFVTMEMDIGTTGIGIEAFQFIIFDVDLGGWVDRLQFRGSLDGVSVAPLITPSAQNYVSGNEAIGQNGNAAQTSGAGNVIVTFNQPVDRVEWDYGNHSSAGPDPAFQIIAMHTVKMCGRRIADLDAVKTVEVYDPGSLGLYMTPGNEVLYKITVTNSASATAIAEDVDITDTLPTNLKFVSATTTGFTGGAFGTPDLPPTNTDCDVTPCVVRFSGGDIAIDTTAEITVRAMIK